MRVLHVLDAACARPTDYGRRTHALLTALRSQGVQTVHVSAPDSCRSAGGDEWPHHAWHLYRTPAPRTPRWLPQGAAEMDGRVELSATRAKTSPESDRLYTPCIIPSLV